MKYASEDLVNEHEGILFGMTILERMADMVGNSEMVDVGEVREMVGFSGHLPTSAITVRKKV